jgi:tryptophan 2,3-dioxygenase
MRVADFRDVRRHTEGASAIQSEAYRRFELACGTPTPERPASEALAGAPGVEPAADTLTDAYAALPADADGVTELRAAMSALEADHQRWKTAHHALTARMLGDAPGSGPTSGVPYPGDTPDNRLFPATGEQPGEQVTDQAVDRSADAA